MAAKDEGLQQFPLAKSTLLSEQELQEHLKIAANVKDGQKSACQSEQDPYTQAVKYLEQHRILEVFQVSRKHVQRDCGETHSSSVYSYMRLHHSQSPSHKPLRSRLAISYSLRT